MLAQSRWNGPLSGPIRENRTRPQEDELGKSREKSHKSSTLTLSIRSCVARTWIIDRVTDAGCTAPQPHASGRLVPGGHRPGRRCRAGYAAQQPSEPEARTRCLRPGLHRRRWATRHGPTVRARHPCRLHTRARLGRRRCARP